MRLRELSPFNSQFYGRIYRFMAKHVRSRETELSKNGNDNFDYSYPCSNALSHIFSSKKHRFGLNITAVSSIKRRYKPMKRDIS